MKLVKESISFKRKENTYQSIGVGSVVMKIEKWLKDYKIYDYNINNDYTIDVDSDINISHMGLNSFPDYIKFNKINGYFNCSYNNLISLEGCPKEINGDFYCYNNNLISLEGCPKKIYGVFNCAHNKLTSLEGCPKEVVIFYCKSNAKKFTKKYVKSLCDVKDNVII